MTSAIGKGGVTPLHKAIRDLFEYHEWIKNVFTRDGFTCQKCNKRGIELNAHHIKLFSEILIENNIKTIGDAISCQILWDIHNGISLCKKCHKKTYLKLLLTFL